MGGGGGGGELCRPCSCYLRGLTSAPGLCCGAFPSYPVAVVGIPLLFLIFLFLFCFICFFVFIYARPVTAVYSCVYVLQTFDKTSDVVSYGTVPRTFFQDTVVCWLVATTACSCGFRTIDIVWRGPVFLVPGFRRRLHPYGFGGCPHRPGLLQYCVLVKAVFLLTFLTFNFLTYDLTYSSCGFWLGHISHW